MSEDCRTSQLRFVLLGDEILWCQEGEEPVWRRVVFLRIDPYDGTGMITVDGGDTLLTADCTSDQRVSHRPQAHSQVE